MSFGLKSSPAIFHRAIDVILSRYKWKTCIVYLKDVIIYSNSIEYHVGQVEDVLYSLRRAEVPLKMRKCNFSQIQLCIWAI